MEESDPRDAAVGRVHGKDAVAAAVPSHPGAVPRAPGRRLVGRPVGLLVPAVLLVVLASLTWQVGVHGALLGLDRAVRAHVQALREGALGMSPVEHAAQGLSDLGGAGVAVPVLAAAALGAAWRLRARGTRRWWLPLPVAAAAVLVLLVTVIPGKVLVGRPGPDGQAVVPGGWGWFPSGHTATSSVCYGSALLLLLPVAGRLAFRWVLAALVSALLLAVGASLVWCDYHWLLDVVASWCLSGIVLWGVVLVQWRWGPGLVRGGGSGGVTQAPRHGRSAPRSPRPGDPPAP